MKSKRDTVAQLLAAALDEADELPSFFERVTDAVYRLESRSLATGRTHNRAREGRRLAQRPGLPARSARRKKVR
jgi:hypothetical protein